MALNGNVEPTKQDRFLEAFAALGVITYAAKAAGCSHQAHYQWLQRDPDYPAKFRRALAMALDRAEAEVLRRGLVGWDEPVYGTQYNTDPTSKHYGRPIGKHQVGTVRRYSDKLLLAWLAARNPAEWGQHVEHSGRIEGPPATVVQLVMQSRQAAMRMVSADGEVVEIDADGKPLPPAPGGDGQDADDDGDTEK